MASKQPSDGQIRQFWDWFVCAEHLIAAGYQETDVQAELDRRVVQLGVMWEVGPGRSKTLFLALTPDGDPARLEWTRHIVSLAPELDAWELYPARPKKTDWNLRFSIRAANGARLEVDARAWRYVLYRYPDHMVDVVVEQRGLSGASEDDRYTAAALVLDGLLGEELRLATVCGIEPTESLAPELTPRASPIDVIEAHLLSAMERG